MLVPSHHNSGRGGSLNVLTGTGTACWLQRRKTVGCWGTPLPVDFGTRRRMTQRSRQALLAIPRPPSRVWERSYIRYCSGLLGARTFTELWPGLHSRTKHPTLCTKNSDSRGQALSQVAREIRQILGRVVDGEDAHFVT